MGLFNRRIKRLGADRYRVQLPEPERELLASLIPQLRTLLSSDDQSLTRLFPTAYPDDAERDAGYRALAGNELVEKRFATLDILEATIDGGEMDGETLSSWMRGLNDLRLVIGTNLDVDEDDDPYGIDPEDPEAATWTIYHYLGGLVGMIVDAMTSDLPPGED